MLIFLHEILISLGSTLLHIISGVDLGCYNFICLSENAFYYDETKNKCLF